MMFHSIQSYAAQCRRRGMTLIEMIVAIGILVIVILAVGLIFSGASNAVGTSQKVLEVLSNVRSVQWQIEHDLAGLDRNGFLVIRSATFTDSQSVTRRCDLLTFSSYGSFPHRTGRSSTSPFTDNAPRSPYALITWGQLVLESPNSSWTAASSDPSLDMPTDQTKQVPQNQVPTGVKVDPSGNVNAGGMILGRNALLLFPKNDASANNFVKSESGISIGAFQSFPLTSPSSPTVLAIDWNASQATAVSPDGVGSHITQSRVDVAAITASQITSFLTPIVLPSRSAANMRYEADHFCFRHASLRSPYDGLSTTNGYFRMHPIALQGVSSFAVEWSDGVSTYAAGDYDPAKSENIPTTVPADPRVGTLKWFGMNNSKSGTMMDPIGGTPLNMNGDKYCAIFSYDTPKANWPAALRFRYHVDDPTNRLQGGRDFVEIVKLPN